MANSKVFKFISDPGHGWLEVTMSDIQVVGLTPASFSRYSYRKDDRAYLEEDCDATRFVIAYRNFHGFEPVTTSVYQSNTPIRNYAALNGMAA